ncbi:MAG: hypothetical protein AAGB48_01805 [Planctomycetota bacterium]
MSSDMSPDKMLETALLEAAGLLEPDQSTAFEAAFAAAPESIRAMIRREQARFADMTTLPDVMPSKDLKHRVVGRVMDEAGYATDAIGEAIFAGSASTDTAAPGSARSRRSLSFWRVATFAAGTAAVFMGVLTVQLQTEFNRVGQQITSNQATQFFLWNTPNAEFRTAVLSPAFDRLPLTGVEGAGSETEASIFINSETGRGHLAMFDMPELAENEAYVLVQLGDDGEVLQRIDRFTPGEGLANISFTFQAALGTTFGVARASGDTLTLVLSTA